LFLSTDLVLGYSPEEETICNAQTKHAISQLIAKRISLTYSIEITKAEYNELKKTNIFKMKITYKKGFTDKNTVTT